LFLLLYENRRFAKTGSGQTQRNRKDSKDKGDRFMCSANWAMDAVNQSAFGV
jgi:hypothetical protein